MSKPPCCAPANLSSADVENIAEEIESMGKSEKRELVSRLTILLLQLLKWQFQPGLRGNSWRYTIKVQRHDLDRNLADNPSLSAQLPALLGDSYASAVLLAAGETGLPEGCFRPLASGHIRRLPILIFGRTHRISPSSRSSDG